MRLILDTNDWSEVGRRDSRESIERLASSRRWSVGPVLGRIWRYDFPRSRPRNRGQLNELLRRAKNGDLG